MHLGGPYTNQNKNFLVKIRNTGLIMQNLYKKWIWDYTDAGESAVDRSDVLQYIITICGFVIIVV